MTTMNQKLKIFISHSSSDKDIASTLTEIISLCYPCQEGDIVCSSAEGFRFSPQISNYYNFIKQNIEDASLVIYILSKSFKTSEDCLYELAWGYSKGHTNKIFFYIKEEDNIEKVKLYPTTPYVFFDAEGLIALKQILDSVFNTKGNEKVWTTKIQKLETLAKNASQKKKKKQQRRGTPSSSSSRVVSAIITDNPKSSQAAKMQAVNAIAHENEKTDTQKNKQPGNLTILDDNEVAYNILVQNVQQTLNAVCYATRWSIFITQYKNRERLNAYEYNCEPSDFQEAHDHNELNDDCCLNTSNRNVTNAITALENFSNFMTDPQNFSLINRKSEEVGIDFELSNIDFWKKILL